jgi:glucokinase
MAKRKQPHFIGVDLGGTNVRAALVDHDHMIRLKEKSIRSQGTEKEVFEDLCTVIDAVFDNQVKGIGIGVPSLVNPDNGVIFDTTNIPSWKKVPLKKWLEKKYKKPVTIDNDANCFALGEKHFGAGKSCENFVGLITGTGLGAGIISNGKLHSGAYCGAGEFGMLPYRDSILEHYASGQFFRRFNKDGATLAQAAKAGDAQAIRIFNEYGEHLAHAIKIILYTLAPEMIVLGGSVSLSFPFFKTALEESLKDFAYSDVLRNLKIKTSKLKNAAVLGAASLAEES